MESIKNDLKLITSNKLNSFQSKLFLIGIVHEIILRKDLFPKNSDLKNFVQVVFVDPIEGIKPFREYLFLSRTLLSSRVSNIILQNFEFSNVIKTVDMLYNILPEHNINEHSPKNKNSENDINEWINLIRGNSK
ncbi:hypothetical protein ABEY65_03550 [Priestia aryabhattai]|uniref:hypothetical protein n=1 Tax=Priestia aryabhattai TaxID=412384 RepID=UPI003D295868